MNILLNKLPQSVNIGGFEVQINSNFKTSINFEELLNKYDLDKEEEQREFYNEGLRLYYPLLSKNFNSLKVEEKILFNHIVDNSSEAINKMLWFYKCGKEFKENKEGKSAVDIYSFEHDAETIYSAFLDQYGIDLQEIDYLHWWKFKALFRALKDDNEISKIMSIRAMDINSLSKEQKEHYRKLKKIYEIPKDKKLVKADDDLTKALLEGKDISNLL